MNYHIKYLKYKQKYLDLKEEIRGGNATLNEADEKAFQAWLKEKGKVVHPKFIAFTRKKIVRK